MTRLRKRIPRGLAASLVILAAALFGASIAQAESAAPSAPVLQSTGASPAQVSPLSPEQCAYGYYCAWRDIEFSGSFWFWGNPKNEWFYVGSGANDQISSDWNRHQNATYVNKDWTPKTFQFCIGAGGSHSNYGGSYPQPPYPVVEDSISAIYIKTSGC